MGAVDGEGDALVRQCGKFAALDRILVKLFLSGHRVLLFSTMTRLLDLLETYLRTRFVEAEGKRRLMQYLRIDGSTSLEDRCDSMVSGGWARDGSRMSLLRI